MLILIEKLTIGFGGVAKRGEGAWIIAQLCGYTGHPRSTEPVKDDIARFGIVQNVPHDGLVRHLGVVGVSVVDWIIFSLTHIRSKGLETICHIRVIRLAKVLNEILNKRVRTSGIIRQI